MNLKTAQTHTPGPWYVSGLPKEYNHDYINADGPNPVCQILRRHSPEEDAANARLIAAAPKMRVALQAIADMYATYTEESNPDEIATLCIQIARITIEAIEPTPLPPLPITPRTAPAPTTGHRLGRKTLQRDPANHSNG